MADCEMKKKECLIKTEHLTYQYNELIKVMHKANVMLLVAVLQGFNQAL